MKILIIHTFYRDSGGEEVLVSTEMDLLRDAGFQVELLGFQNPTGGLRSIPVFLALPFNFPSFLKTIDKIRRFRPDVVHLHNWHFAASPSVIVACQLSKVPTVMSFHNFRLLCPSGILFHDKRLFLDSLEQSFPWKAIRLGVYRNSVPQTFWLAFSVYLHKMLGTWRRVDACIVNSEFERQTFLCSSLGLAGDRLKIKANSLPEPIFDASLRRQSHFLFVGRLVAEKGVDVLMEAFAKTRFKLVIYGYGPLEEKVKSFAADHENIEFKGPLPHARMSDELRTCTALVFPSTWFEGMPMTLVHAFSTGTPVIASKIGAMATMVVDRQNGLHFEAGSREDLIAKLQQWSDLTEAERESYGTRSRSIFETTYSPQANRQSLEAIYKAVVGSTIRSLPASAHKQIEENR